jgi:hypothetical protein
VPTPALHDWHVPPPSHAFDGTPALPSPLLLRLHRWCVLVGREDERRERERCRVKGEETGEQCNGVVGLEPGPWVEVMWGPQCGPKYII